MIINKAAALTGALVASIVLLTACGGAQNDASSSNRSNGSSSSEVQTRAKAKAAEYAKGPSSYPGPTTAFNPRTGKAAVLACGLAAAVCAQSADEAVKALKAMGWDSPPPFDGQFSPQIQGGFLERAVQDRLAGVVIVAADVNTFKASTDRAVAAGIKIVCVQCDSGPDWKGKVYDVTTDFYEQGQIAAWQIIASAGDRAKVAGFQDQQFSSAVKKQQGLKDGLAQNCPNCTVDIRPFNTASVAKPGPPEFTALLASKPAGTLDYVVGHYDGLSVVMAKTAENSGRTELKIGGYDGSPDGIASLVSTKVLDFDVSEAVPYETWAAVDLLGRAVAGESLWTGYDKMPSTLITRENAKKYLDQPGGPMPQPEGDWRSTFLKYWGKA